MESHTDLRARSSDRWPHLTRQAIAVCLCLVSLAACERRPVGDGGIVADSAATDSNISPTPTQPAMVVTEWVALGNEPFWNVRIMPDSIVWRTPEHLEGIHFPPAVPESVAGEIRWRTQRSGTPSSLELSITRMECSDGMSDRVYPFKATLRLDSETFTGCAEERAAPP